MPQPSIIEINSHADARGSLSVVENSTLPFDIRRVYYLYGVPIGAIRGEHGHKKLEQVIICMHGRVDITLNDGLQQHPFILDRPSQGLHVPPGMWRSLYFREPGTVVCVLASRPYEVEDYIYNFEDFRTWATGRRDGTHQD